MLRERPVPLVSFTFGLPPAPDVTLLRRTGALLAQTVTSVDEARAAASAGMDVLVVQAAAAGGHSGTFTPDRPSPELPLADLVGAIRSVVVDLPVVAAGGIGSPRSRAMRPRPARRARPAPPRPPRRGRPASSAR
ncbi:nitronate monooxygenase [Asanoa sp. NPDC050611]|uniref:nitronate monooxygenase n=1 Tax=Asanoa sp. NPDC050611 TaxID=3157098 RepID=UPI0033E58635